MLPAPCLVEFNAAIRSIYASRNPKFINAYKAKMGDQFRPLTVLLSLYSFRYNFDSIIFTRAFESDPLLLREYNIWVMEIVVPELESDTLSKSNRIVEINTTNGKMRIDLNTTNIDAITATCEIGEEGYPILKTRPYSASILREEGGKGRIIHIMDDVTVTRVTCS